MSCTFTASLRLGSTSSLWIPVSTGSLPKPILRVQPDSVVSRWTKVTFFCEETIGANEYRLYKDGKLYKTVTKNKQKPANKAEFSLSNVDSRNAGQYRCSYSTQYKSSGYSDPSESVVTGDYWTPSLLAQASPVVTSGGYVTLQCESWHNDHKFISTVEGPQKLSWTQDSQYNYSTRKYHASFSVGPVTPNQRWICRCYSYDRNRPYVWSPPSESVELSVSGNLQKPTIKAEPGPVIASKRAMTIWCQGNSDAEVYFSHNEGSQKTQSTQTLQQPGNKGKFFIPSMTRQHAGQYRCYCYGSAGWSQPSDTSESVVTGIYEHYKPRSSVSPSPVVTAGGNMTLHCASDFHYDKFILTKEDKKFGNSSDTEHISSSRQYRASFIIGPTTPTHTGTFRCYGYFKNAPQSWSVPSDLQQILISGSSKKPSSSTHQGHISDPGMTLTSQCYSDINYDRFASHKVGGADIMQHSSQQTDTGFSVANFTSGYVSSSTGGQYRCYGAHNLSSEWSASSEPSDISITGQLPLTPSLSVKPNHTVHSGETVSSSCWSMDSVDTFISSKEGSAQQPLRLKSKSHDQQSQAEFSMSAVTSHLSGTYRCYGAQNSSFYLLSSASAPVELTVSGPIETSTPPPTMSMPLGGSHMYSKALIGVSVAFISFLFILIFILLRRRHRGKFRKDVQKEKDLQLSSGAEEPITRKGELQKRPNPAAATQEESLYASVEDMQTEDGVESNSWTPPEEDPQGETYAQVKPSRLRKAGHVSPSVMSREQSNTEYEQAEEGQGANNQAAESGESQDVTYAQSCSRTLRQGAAASPLSQAGEAPEEPSVYATSAAARPEAVPKDVEQ